MGNNQSSKADATDSIAMEPGQNLDNGEHEIPIEMITDLTEAFYACEKRMLIHSGVPFEEFKIHNVVIDEAENYIRTIEVGRGDGNR